MLTDVLKNRKVFQCYNHWYVLDDEFTWDLQQLHQQIFSCLDIAIDIPIVFCDSCEANKIVSELGEEEVEYLQFAAGLYWREVGIIFIFQFDDYLPLVETIFHELRHVMQESIPSFQHQFEHDKKLPYEKRLTEIDAFQFAATLLKSFTSSFTNNVQPHLS
ncbi:hypothetical protein CN918_27060 [Priestia megaterium]|nr:hypothetical protein CN918_27060 [Priestia megaterium]